MGLRTGLRSRTVIMLLPLCRNPWIRSVRKVDLQRQQGIADAEHGYICFSVALHRPFRIAQEERSIFRTLAVSAFQIES